MRKNASSVGGYGGRQLTPRADSSALPGAPQTLGSTEAEHRMSASIPEIGKGRPPHNDRAGLSLFPLT